MARVLYKLVALVAGTVLGPAATVSCGGAYGPDCESIRWAAETCYGPTRAINEKIACESCNAALRYNAMYFECFTSNECTDTDDTETLTVIAACLNDNSSPCER